MLNESDVDSSVRKFNRVDLSFVALLLVFGSIVYGGRLTDLTIRGEESRRALVAVEILRTGDWVVPRLQDELYFSRPPLQNWLIAIGGQIRGQVDVWAIRWYSCIATTLTGVLIYFYSRAILGRAASLVAGLSFLTSLQVLELGRLGETEALFTMLISASLMLWHLGELKHWSHWPQWLLAFTLAGIATLTKGPQAPTYFAACIGLYLLATRQWRRLYELPFLCGIAVYALVVGVWLVPYGLMAGWDSVPKIFMDNVALQFSRQTTWDLVVHMVTYPVEVLVCLLPWSPFLLSYFQKSFREYLRPYRRALLFCGLTVLVTFPSVWLVPGARARYYMPIYPFIAPLIAISIQGCWAGSIQFHWQHGWQRLLTTMSVLAGGVTIGCLGLSLTPGTAGSVIAYSTAQWIGCALLSGIVTFTLYSSRSQRTVTSLALGACATAAFMAIAWNQLWMEATVQRSISIESEVRELAATVPDDAIVISIDDVDHKFAFFFGRSIKRIAREDLPEFVSSLTQEEHSRLLVCFKENFSKSYAPEFIDWREFASVATDRHQSSSENKRVVLAELIPEMDLTPGIDSPPQSTASPSSDPSEQQSILTN